MIGRRDFDGAIRDGERNRDTITLVHNWCANAKIEGMGRGLVAQQTNLPIGHHAIHCDFASDDTTSYCYELSEAAVDFYDRNCQGCAHRKGGRLPNLMELVGERDRKRSLRAAEETKAEDAAQAALAARDEQRRKLRSQLSAVGQTLVDDIGAYDRDRSRENLDRLMRSAELAPEHFSTPLVEYIFEQLETSNWFDTPGLQMLNAVGADTPRLAAAAARVLSKGAYTDLAARVLEPVVEHLDFLSVTNATPAAIELAAPDPRMMIGIHRDSQPNLLLALYQHDPAAVESALGRLLDLKTSHSVESAGRGMAVLLPAHPDAATSHRRALISTFVRAPLMIDDFDELTFDLYGVADAVIGAFDAEPDSTDAMIQEYAEGASEQVRARVYELYGRALRAKFNETLPENSDRVRIAFRRLLWATTGAFNAEILQTAISAFRDGRHDLQAVAGVEIEALLSAPFLLADRLDELEATPLNTEFPLAGIERMNHRSALREVMRGLVRLAAHAAANNRGLIPRLAQFLEDIPEEQSLVRGLAIKEFAVLASDLAGYEFYLPHLYRAMVGPSTLERAYAADAMGELSQAALDNSPDLLFEAFVPLLSDPYVMVHKAAARAFRRSALPQPLRQRALRAIYNLVRHYRVESGEDNFVADCVQTLAGSADEFGQRSGALRRYLIDVSMDIDPIYLRSPIRNLSHTLGTEPSFAKLVIRLLPTMTDRFNRDDQAERLVRSLTASAILQHQREFEELGVSLASNEQWLTLVVIDALARSGAAEAAARVARARLERIDDVPRNQNARLFAKLIVLGFDFEAATAATDGNLVNQVADEWKDVDRALKQHREEQRERDSRSRLSFPN